MKKALYIAKTLLAVLPLLALIVASSAYAADTLARFKGGIGVNPVSNGVGTAATAEVVTRNIVRGVQPPGQPWVIADLKARVKEDGSIKVDGRGLLLAGGANVGGNGNASVFATLLCANDGNVQHNSNLAGVPLELDGDFSIDDVLAPLPPIPCDNPVLLIRNAANLGWFAAGIPER